MNVRMRYAIIFYLALSIVGPGSVAAEELRNPFTLPPGVVLKKNLPESDQPAPPPIKLTLQAVTRFMGNKIASINDRNYELGDDVFGKILVDIEDERVVLEDKTGRISLTLNRPGFSLQVVEGF